MNNLELKGGILQMIAAIDDSQLLEELNDVVSNFLQNQSSVDFMDELGEFEKSELEKALKESEDENNLVSHDEVMKKYAQWLYK